MLLLALDAPATVGSFTLLAVLLLFTTVWSGSFTWAFATVDSTAAPPVISKVSPLIQTLILYALDMLSNFHTEELCQLSKEREVEFVVKPVIDCFLA